MIDTLLVLLLCCVIIIFGLSLPRALHFIKRAFESKNIRLLLEPTVVGHFQYLLFLCFLARIIVFWIYYSPSETGTLTPIWTQLLFAALVITLYPVMRKEIIITKRFSTRLITLIRKTWKEAEVQREITRQQQDANRLAEEQARQRELSIKKSQLDARVKSGELSIRRCKVLTQKDKWFSGKFDPQLLEDALNAYGEQGWELDTAVTATIPGVSFGGNEREEVVFILGRKDTP